MVDQMLNNAGLRDPNALLEHLEDFDPEQLRPILKLAIPMVRVQARATGKPLPLDKIARLCEIVIEELNTGNVSHD
jgi:hypothetical protein